MLVVVGAEPRTSEVTAALDDLKLSIHRKAWLPDSELRLPEESCAVLLVSPIPSVDILCLAEQLNTSDQVKALPIFVVVADGTPDREVRGLYTAGVSAVFEWPREAPKLAELIAERLAITFARGLTLERDAALSRTVRAHLRTSSRVPSTLKISARRGVVELRGEVDALFRKRELETLVRDIPGVRWVVTEDLRVQPTARPDDQIEASIRSVLSATSDVADETVAVSSTNGFVVLAGSADHRRELDRILQLVTHVRGVRGIEVLMTISPRAKSVERATARRLQRAVDRLLHEGEVNVSVFGGTVVLDGEVRDAIARGMIEYHVSRDDAVQRVVNKLNARNPNW